MHEKVFKKGWYIDGNLNAFTSRYLRQSAGEIRNGSVWKNVLRFRVPFSSTTFFFFPLSD